MDHADVAAREDRKVFFRGPHHVRGDRRPCEEPEGLQVLYRCLAEVFLAVVDFEAGFGDVNADRHTELERQRTKLLELLGLDRVDRVRADDRHHAVVLALPALDEFTGTAQPFRRIRGVGTLLVDHGRCDERTQPAALHDLRDALREVVHVDESGGAAADHFPAGELGADAHEFGIDEAHFGGEDIVRSQSISSRSSAIPRSRVMAAWVCPLMRPGSTMRSLPGERLVSLGTWPTISARRADRQDGALVDHDRALLQHRLVAVHGHDVVAVDDQVDRGLSGAGRDDPDAEVAPGR